MDNKKLFVGNISYNLSDDDLKSAFEEAGTVVSAAIITDRDSGRSKGFGFVEMGSVGEAQKAMDMWDGKELDGRQLAVKEARPQREKQW